MVTPNFLKKEKGKKKESTTRGLWSNLKSTHGTFYEVMLGHVRSLLGCQLIFCFTSNEKECKTFILECMVSQTIK